MKSTSHVLAVFVLFLVSGGSVLAQQYRAAPLVVQRSTFIEQLKALKSSRPKATPAELVEAANALLDKNGLNYAMILDAATCDRLRKTKAEQKDPTQPLRLGANLKSVNADGATLALPEPVMASSDCGCYLELPLLQVTEVDFIAILSGRNIKFHLPTNLATHEVHLLDPRDTKVIKRKWRIPFRASPIGVSHDENVVYLAFHEPELSDLTLVVFGEGVFQIGTRAEAEDGGRGKLQEGVTPDRVMRFDRWGNSYLVRFRQPCS